MAGDDGSNRHGVFCPDRSSNGRSGGCDRAAGSAGRGWGCQSTLRAGGSPLSPRLSGRTSRSAGPPATPGCASGTRTPPMPWTCRPVPATYQPLPERGGPEQRPGQGPGRGSMRTARSPPAGAAIRTRARRDGYPPASTRSTSRRSPPTSPGRPRSAHLRFEFAFGGIATAEDSGDLRSLLVGTRDHAGQSTDATFFLIIF
jgi:hypothetical protein